MILTAFSLKLREDKAVVFLNLIPIFANITIVPSWDLLIFILFIVAIFLYGLTAGKNRLIILLLNTYFSLVVITSFPWELIRNFSNSKEFPSPTAKIFLFLAIIIALSFLVPRSVLGSAIKINKFIRGAWFQVLIFSICEIGLLSTIVLSFLPKKVLADINPLIKQMFTGAEFQFFWFLLPILAMVLIRPRKTEI